MQTILRILFFFLLVTQICFAQWVKVGLTDINIQDIAVQDSVIFAVTSDSGKVYRSLDNGNNWTVIVDSKAVDVAISPTGKVFMVKGESSFLADSLYSSLDNGDTWTYVNIAAQLSDSMACVPNSITISPTGIIFCGLHRACMGAGIDALAKSTDDGLTWTTPGEGIIGGTLFDFRDEFVITVGECHCMTTSCSYIYLSPDYGNTWNDLPTSYDYPSHALSFFPNGNILIGQDLSYGGTGPFALYFSDDIGSTWTQITELNCQRLVGISWSNGLLEGMLIGTDVGIFLFSDEGDSLGSMNVASFWNDILDLTLDNTGYIYASTVTSMMLGSGGLWRIPLSEITPVEENQIQIPSSFNLSQNFPNPFNPSTKIKYSVPQTSQVQIKVFDILGNEIETLVNEEKPVGTYELTWNAVNLPSGVYFYQLRAGEFVQTKKMILIK